MTSNSLHRSPHSMGTPSIAIAASPKSSNLGKMYDPNFIEYCQQAFTFYVGPIAPFLMDILIQEQPHLNQQEFVDLLATYIKRPEQATQFHQRLTERNVA